MSDEKVPEQMRAIYDEIVALTDAACGKHLSQEYADLSRKMAATLSRKRPSPLTSGRAKTWAAGIVYALGRSTSCSMRHKLRTCPPAICARCLR